MVTGECTLPDDTHLNINFENLSIAQSVIISASGWIYDTFADIAGSVNDLVSDLTEIHLVFSEIQIQYLNLKLMKRIQTVGLVVFTIIYMVKKRQNKIQYLVVQ